MNLTCALTGHRELPPDFNQSALYDSLEELVHEGYDMFLCGMAEGFDLLALDCLVALKQKYRIAIEACIPFAGQEKNFPGKEQKKYRDLLVWCDKKTVLSAGFRNGCFLLRNRYMVDHADLLFAYCMRETGGTAYTVNYAVERGIPIRNFKEM